MINRQPNKLHTHILNNKLKLSSRKWLERHINDKYVQQAQLDGYISRAAYKLIELDKKFNLLYKSKMQVIDLGAAPGGWTQVITKKLSNYDKNNQVYAIDIKDLHIFPNVNVIKANCLNTNETIEKLQILNVNAINSFDLLLSDMAPPSCGDTSVDHMRIIELAEASLKISIRLLKPQGTMVVKILHGNAELDLIKNIRQYFNSIKYYKPLSSYKTNSEIYLVLRNLIKKSY